MMWISFAWTTQELLEGKKTVTRRMWMPKHAAKFHEGDLVNAWSKNPRCRGAKCVAVIRLTKVYKERLGDMPESDVAAEGGRWPSKKAFIEGMSGVPGGVPDMVVWVIRFKLEKVLDYGKEFRY